MVKQSNKKKINNFKSTFEYMERKGTEKQDVVEQYPLADYPKELQKKVTLLQHFRSYLEGEAKINPVR